MNTTYSLANPGDEILPGLWLGSIKAATNTDWLTNHRIKVVFNCTKDIPYHPIVSRTYRIPVDDNLQEEEIRNLKLWSPEIAHKLLTLYNQGHTILVHCYAGMQRSAACVAIFLIALKHMSGQDAMKYIRSRRSVAFQPRANFGRSIEFFEHDFFNRILPSINRKT